MNPPAALSRSWRLAAPLVALLLCITACRQGARAPEASASRVGTRILPIPPRLQWQTEHGYCGEASIQSAALYFGAWISQDVIRKAAGGEVLLGENEVRALETLGLRYESWTPQREDSARDFLRWMKERLLQGVPCIMAVYLEGSSHAEYDHIVPVVGVASESEAASGFDPQDELIFYSLFSLQPIRRRFGSLPSTRTGCRSGLASGGTIPEARPYGVAIWGLQDAEAITLPVRLSVNASGEPEVTHGEQPLALKGRVHVSGLRSGGHYALFRYNRVEDMPVQGGVKAYLNSRFAGRTDFYAGDSTWLYVDSTPILSCGVAYYRCVPLP